MLAKSTSSVMTTSLSEDAPLLSDHSGRSTPNQPLLAHRTSRRSLRSTRSSRATENVSAGVARISAASANLTTFERTILFLSVFVVGYAYGLESQVRTTYQPYATASFSLHSYLATINVFRGVIASAAQPTAAKVADVFGRFEVVLASTILYVLGIAIESTASSVESYCIGAIIYQIGYTCIVLLMEVLMADFSSMRARVFFSYVPAIPFLVNTWISGNITSAVLERTTWRWGIGMWGIIYPIASAPLLITLYIFGKRPSVDSRSSKKKKSFAQATVELYHQLDIVGLLALVLSISFILAPLTLSHSSGHTFSDPAILVPLIIGLILFPAFVYWERSGARLPLIPFHLLTDRGVWSALAVRSLLNFAWSTQGNYLYTVLIVAFDFKVDMATRILSFFSFFGVLSGVVMGLVIYRVRRLKSIIVAGTCIFMLAFIVLIQYPGGATDASRRGLVAAQVLMGVASGFFAYPTQASIQASAKREHVAIITGLYLSFYNIGSALGTSLSGLIWTTTLLDSLKDNLSFQGNNTLAEAIYNSPFDVLKQYPVGTDVREAVIRSYSGVQAGLGTAGLGICVPMIAFALLLRNPRLGEHEVQEDEGEDGA